MKFIKDSQHNNSTKKTRKCLSLSLEVFFASSSSKTTNFFSSSLIPSPLSSIPRMDSLQDKFFFSSCSLVIFPFKTKSLVFIGPIPSLNWARECPNSQCGGHSQSPVPTLSFQNMISFDQYLLESIFNYSSSSSIQVLYDFTNETKRSLKIHGLLVFDGPTGYKSIRVPYELKQFHFHTPSEHVFNWFSYDLEMHLVFQRGDLSQKLDEAKKFKSEQWSDLEAHIPRIAVLEWFFKRWE